MSREITSLLRNIAKTLASNSDLFSGDSFSGDLSDAQRMKMVDALSQAGSDYRQQLYDAGLSGEKVELPLDECVSLLQQCLQMIDHTIHVNRRSDGLYHSYNLIGMHSDGYTVTTLQEMLEGQVAVLNSGLLSAEQAVQIIDALYESPIYRADQQSFMLYPDRQLATFLNKNNLDTECWGKSALLQQLIADGNGSVVRQDNEGGVHFSGDFRNVADLRTALNSLAAHPEYAKGVAADADLICDLFESAFFHRSFTGRSGTFFAYEGLGSIYWHMVSKLALTAIENCMWSIHSGAPSQLTEKLQKHYRRIRDGIGLAKSPARYGAFPADPYSHTPQNAGVQQPGMTGQVKEDILSRFAELGVRIQNGQLGFDPFMLEVCELLGSNSKFQFVDRQDEFVEIVLPAGSFAFTICQTPVVYHQATEAKIIVSAIGEEPEDRCDLLLTPNETRNIFARTGAIKRIDVFYNFKQAC